MDPTFDRGRRFLLVKVGLLYYFSSLNRGDVVIARNPRQNSKDDIVKRVVGLPLDTVVKHPRGWCSRSPEFLTTVTLTKDQIWLQGDNMRHSVDSRTYGPLPINQVYGKVICQIYPSLKMIANTMEHSGQGKEFQKLATSYVGQD